MSFAAVPLVMLALQQSVAPSSECMPCIIAGFESGVVRLLHLCKGGWHVVAALRLHEGECKNSTCTGNCHDMPKQVVIKQKVVVYSCPYSLRV